MVGHATGNLSTHEGTCTTTATVTFAWPIRQVVITNDSATQDLSFKFNTGETFATLKPTETVSMRMGTRTVFLAGTSVPYRVWGTG